MENFSEILNFMVDSTPESWEAKIYLPLDFKKISNVAGIYGWHLIPSNFLSTDSIVKYSEVFTDNKIGLSGKSNFSNYAGDLAHLTILDRDKISNVLTCLDSRKKLSIASALFSPSLYIGISENICKRINQHFTIIDTLYHKNSAEIFYDSLQEEEQKIARDFGERISSLFARLGTKNFSLNDFFVKILYFKKFKDREKLEGIEHFLNRTYKPKFGKK